MIKIENFAFIAAITALIAAFFYFLLGFSAMVTILGIIILVMTPVYLILDNFGFSQSEKIVFSFLIGIGIFSSIAYWLGFLMPFKVAIFVTFILLVISAFAVKKFLVIKQ
ncbi:hypothetical protein HYX01_04920 [Candidatus Woesearchaeota archaeon]|nr:hypothetical protein [Candidatus Woesearchaeota archaeon]